MVTISIAVTFVPLTAVILLLPHCLLCKHKIIQNNISLTSLLLFIFHLFLKYVDLILLLTPNIG